MICHGFPRLFALGLFLVYIQAADQSHAADELTPAQESSAQVARRLFAQAEAKFAAAEYEAALVLFRQAMAAQPHDALLFNMAVCLEKLGRTEDARQTYEAAAQSLQLDDEARERARRAAENLLPPTPLPEVKPPVAPQPALDLRSREAPARPNPGLRTWGWVGAAAATTGVVASTSLWVVGQRNEDRYEQAIADQDLPRARALADRGDGFDGWLKVSVSVALVGAAVVVADLLLREP